MTRQEPQYLMLLSKAASSITRQCGRLSCMWWQESSLKGGGSGARWNDGRWENRQEEVCRVGLLGAGSPFTSGDLIRDGFIKGVWQRPGEPISVMKWTHCGSVPHLYTLSCLSVVIKLFGIFLNSTVNHFEFQNIRQSIFVIDLQVMWNNLFKHELYKSTFLQLKDMSKAHLCCSSTGNFQHSEWTLKDCGGRGWVYAYVD